MPLVKQLYFNDVLKMPINTILDRVFEWGNPRLDYKKLGVSSYIYSLTPPEIPYAAKYMRVQYGGLTSFDPEAYPLAEHLKQNGKAIIEFSDGSAPDENLLAVNEKCYLKSDGELYPVSGTKAVVSDYIEIPSNTTITKFETYSVSNYAFCCFYDENYEFISTQDSKSRMPMDDGQIIMNLTKYNEVFNTDYTSDNLNSFKPHKVKIAQYTETDYKLNNKIFEIEATITSISTSRTSVSADIAKIIADKQIYPTALYFDGVKGIDKVLKAMENMNYEFQFVEAEAIQTIATAVEVFIPIFRLVAIFLCIAVILLLVSFSVKVIKDKLHDIGILKALGTRNKSIGKIFGLQTVLIAFLTSILSTVGYFMFIGAANDLLVSSLKVLAKNRVVLDMNFLTFQPAIAGINIVLVAVLCAISLFVPLLLIKNIKPVKIIKTKE